VIITIVCHCGHHNQVPEEQLEVAHCLRCFRLLLPESKHELPVEAALSSRP
jgi:hypothetical protein